MKSLILMSLCATVGIVCAFQAIQADGLVAESVYCNWPRLLGKPRDIAPEVIFITKKPATILKYRNGIATSSPSKLTPGANPVNKEFKFNPDTTTLEQLESEGFNKNAPVTFITHGFTAGYPLQTWITSIVESYVLDEYKRDQKLKSAGFDSNDQVSHNVFVVNWHSAAVGPSYWQAVANMHPTAKHVSDFINRVLLKEARISGSRISIVGHSLGGHLSGFIARRVHDKVGRIIGLDPAGPCFRKGSDRLSRSDATNVVTIHTNTDHEGNPDPLGHSSVFVEGGKFQSDCPSMPQVAIESLSLEMKDFEKVACSHNRAPNMVTYQLKTENKDDCEMVGYECSSWDDFTKGFCGVCDSSRKSDFLPEGKALSSPLEPVKCTRIGLDWQYSRVHQDNLDYSPSRKPRSIIDNTVTSTAMSLLPSWLTPGGTEEGKMYLRTTAVQPFCAYHYQVILHLKGRIVKLFGPSLAIVIQDAVEDKSGLLVRNTLDSSEFNKFDDKTYTTLITSSKKIFRPKHATLISRTGLRESDWRNLDKITINYMSNLSPEIRAKHSNVLCYRPTDVEENDGLAGRRFYFSACDN